jgi:hypothetical protein
MPPWHLRTGGTLVLSYVGYIQGTGTVLTTSTLQLPGGSTNIVLDKNSGYVKYSLPEGIINDNNRTYVSIVSAIGLAASALFLFVTLRKKPPSAAPEKRFCTSCGAPISAEAKFCLSCGQKQA